MTDSPALSASETAALQEFMAGVRALLGPQLESARLYGSRARGEGHEHSDLDVALIVTRGTRSLHRDAIYDLAFDVGLIHGVELAPLLLEEPQLQELRALERRLAREIDTGGIPL
jgi:predicted nucleotidyltransferase